MNSRELFILLMIPLLITTAFAAMPGGPIVSIVSSQDNLYPGEKGYLTLTLSNDGDSPAYNTKFTLIGLESPLTSDKLCSICLLYDSTRQLCLQYKDYCYINLGNIYGSNVKMYSVPIIIPENVTSGYYKADFQLEYNNGSSGETAYIDYSVLLKINNENSNPNLVISSIVLPSEGINPGEEFEVILNIKNDGAQTAENIKLELESESFKTIGTSSIIKLSDIPGGSTEQVVLNLISDDSTSIGVHDATINLTYSKNSYSYSSVSSFGLRVGGVTTNFEIFVQKISQDTSGAISLDVSVANVGLVNAKSASLTLNNGEVIVSSLNSKYIGDLASGDYTKASFTFTQGQIRNNTRQEGNNTIPNGNQIPNRNNTAGFPRSINGTAPVFGMINLSFSVSYTNSLGERLNENITKRVDLSSITGSSISSITGRFTQTNTASSSLNVGTVVSYVFIGIVSGVLVFLFVRSKWGRKLKVFKIFSFKGLKINEKKENKKK